VPQGECPTVLPDKCGPLSQRECARVGDSCVLQGKMHCQVRMIVGITMYYFKCGNEGNERLDCGA